MANWSSLVAEHSSFNVELQLSGNQVEVLQKLLESRVQFSGLKRGVNYTVSVSMVNGWVTGPSVEASIYTRESPAPPPSPQQPSQQHTHSNDDFNSPACTVICCDPGFLLVNMILMMLCRSDVCSCSTTVVLVLFYSNILRVVVFSAAAPFRHRGCLRWPRPNHLQLEVAARLWRVQLLSKDQLRLLGPQSLWDGAQDETHLLRPEVWHQVPAGVAKRGERSVQRSSLLFTQHRWDSQGSSHTKNSQIMPVYIFSVMWHSWKMPVWLLDSVEMHW